VHGSDAKRASLPRSRTNRRPGTIYGSPSVLPLRQRAAIVLRFYEDLPEREAADVLGCSTGALHQLVTRALTTLREQLAGVKP
jgi:DNA-directed RNA polymerase specialized sigma subunit